MGCNQLEGGGRREKKSLKPRFRPEKLNQEDGKSLKTLPEREKKKEGKKKKFVEGWSICDKGKGKNEPGGGRRGANAKRSISDESLRRGGKEEATARCRNFPWRGGEKGLTDRREKRRGEGVQKINSARSLRWRDAGEKRKGKVNVEFETPTSRKRKSEEGRI